MNLKHNCKKIQYFNANVAIGILTVLAVSMIATLPPYHNSLVAAQKVKDTLNTNNNTSSMPTSTAAQKNATAESISKATATNSSGITGYNSSNSLRNMINPVFKMTKNPLANISNPLANMTNPLKP
jgi:hypothetical protein